jgi:hypothetical protein
MTYPHLCQYLQQECNLELDAAVKLGLGMMTRYGDESQVLDEEGEKENLELLAQEAELDQLEEEAEERAHNLEEEEAEERAHKLHVLTDDNCLYEPVRRDESQGNNDTIAVSVPGSQSDLVHTLLDADPIGFGAFAAMDASQYREEMEAHSTEPANTDGAGAGAKGAPSRWSRMRRKKKGEQKDAENADANDDERALEGAKAVSLDELDTKLTLLESPDDAAGSHTPGLVELFSDAGDEVLDALKDADEPSSSHHLAMISDI